MAVKVTNLTAVKELMDVAGGTLDADLNQLIDLVHGEFVRATWRDLEKKERTELYDLSTRQHLVSLRQMPVDTGETLTVLHDTEHVFGAEALTLELATDYHVLAGRGQLQILTALSPGYEVLQVTYTAGLAEDQATWDADANEEWAGLIAVAAQQVKYEYDRRNTMGSSATSARDGSKTFTGAVSLLPRVRDAFDAWAIRRRF